MADKTLQERLQPSLLDRLTDTEPGNQKETRDVRVIDLNRLRQIIQRDLSWLLNTINIDDSLDAERYPYVSESVLNYGLSAVSGSYSTGEKAEMIRSAIQRAISLHEPRIIKGTVDVQINAEDADSTMLVGIDIHADMWAQPMPLELYLRSKVDVTTGEVHVEQGG